MNSYAVGSRDTRPWGEWQVLDSGPGFCVKRITVTPGGILSLQRHQHRAEHWIITSGVATVTLGESLHTVKADQSIYIPLGSWHRVENRGDEALTIIEIQTGEILDESDIERREDKYNR